MRTTLLKAYFIRNCARFCYDNGFFTRVILNNRHLFKLKPLLYTLGLPLRFPAFQVMLPSLRAPPVSPHRMGTNRLN